VVRFGLFLGDEGVSEYDFDVVIETEMRSDTLAFMIRAARPGGMLILKSRQPGIVSFDPLPAIRKRLTIRTVNYGSFEKAVGLLVEGTLDLTDLVGGTYPLERFADVLAFAETSESAKLFFDPTS
jgi:threonine dehydrogenase-like Zn-dependent dehydrogenase